MVLTLGEIDKRLAEIPKQIADITAEQHQLMGYKKALQDVEAEATPKNGEVMPSPDKERKAKVAKGV
jgi:hypothetical protein